MQIKCKPIANWNNGDNADDDDEADAVGGDDVIDLTLSDASPPTQNMVLPPSLNIQVKI